MSNRWIRFLLAVLALAAAGGAAYRVVQDEQALAREITSSRASLQAAETALSSIDELKAAMHAYVAPGQSTDFWATRGRQLMDKLQAALLEVDAAASAQGISLGESLDAADRLAAAERRAQSFARTEQTILAGEIIFREARDLIDGLRINLVRVRDELAAATGARQLALRREQTYLFGGVAGVLALVMLLLVPIGAAALAPPPTLSARQARVVDPALDDLDALNASARAQRTPRPSGVTPPATPPSTPAAAPAATAELPLPRKSEVRKAVGRESAPPNDFSTVANLCVDLATVADSAQMEHMLDRARKLLDARGVIVWAGTPDRRALQPVVASGYDARVLARLGSIDCDAANLTADAFRDNAVHSNPPAGDTAAAIAVPLPSPEGASGVLSAELNPGVVLSAESLVAARLIAAQLGALLGESGPKSQDAAGDVPAAGAARSSP